MFGNVADGMIDTNFGVGVLLDTVRIKDIHVAEREPMMLVIVGQKSEGRVLILQSCLEDLLVPVDHFVTSSRHVNHVGQLGWGVP